MDTVHLSAYMVHVSNLFHTLWILGFLVRFSAQCPGSLRAKQGHGTQHMAGVAMVSIPEFWLTGSIQDCRLLPAWQSDLVPFPAWPLQVTAQAEHITQGISAPQPDLCLLVSDWNICLAALLGS